MNDKNLVKFTKETAAEMGRKGGKNSGKSKRKDKELKEWAKLMLSCPAPEKAAEQIAAATGLKASSVTYASMMLFAQLSKACKGNTEAAKYVRDTAGESPTQRVDHTTDGEKIERTWQVVFPEDFDVERLKK